MRPSLKLSRKLLLAAFFVMLFFVMATVNASAETSDEITSIGYSSLNDGKDYYSEVDFHPDMLFTDANTLSGDVAKLSMALASSAYQENRIANMLSTMGFSWDSYDYSREATYSDNDFVAFSIGHRAVEKDGQTYNLWIVPIRGTPGSLEWKSDFNLGSRSDGFHEGFKLAADTVLSTVRNKINTDNNIDRKSVV